MNNIRIDPLSVTSLYLKLQVNGKQLSTATGFVVEHSGKHFLISNWHVFAGRHPDTDKPLSPTAGIPDEVRIAHHHKNELGLWQFHAESLKNEDNSPRWLAHQKGKEIDVAALELRNLTPDIALFPFNMSLAETDILTYPGMQVSIIGFPFGLRPNVFFPIWKTGHIATDPDLPYKGQSAFLIDATTRSGMSGSPVVARISGGYTNSKNIYVISGGVLTKFLGIYSDRIHNEAEIGCVWRPNVITELLETSKPGDF